MSQKHSIGIGMSQMQYKPMETRVLRKACVLEIIGFGDLRSPMASEKDVKSRYVTTRQYSTAEAEHRHVLYYRFT
jgi:hypothetical protein